MRQHDPDINTCLLKEVYRPGIFKPLANGFFNNQNSCKLCKKLFILQAGASYAPSPGFFASYPKGRVLPVAGEAKFLRQ